MGLINGNQIITDCIWVILPVVVTTIISTSLFKKCVNDTLKDYNDACKIYEEMDAKSQSILTTRMSSLEKIVYDTLGVIFRTVEVLVSTGYYLTFIGLKISYKCHYEIVDKFHYDPTHILTMLYAICVTFACTLLINVINYKDKLSEDHMEYFKRRYIFNVIYTILFSTVIV